MCRPWPVSSSMSKFKVLKFLWPLTTILSSNTHYAQFISCQKNTTSNKHLDKSVDHTLNKYFKRRTEDELIEEADHLFMERKYLEVYELLSRLKYKSNLDIKWRIARVIYKATADYQIRHEIQREMVEEAFLLLEEEIAKDAKNAEIHKWFAIILDLKNSLDGMNSRITGFEQVLQHLKISCELNPNDAISFFMLGRLCYELANLSDFKRLVARLLLTEPPKSSFQEAYNYLSKAEELKEKFYLTNVYLLGKTCYKLKQYYRARHYLQIACFMSPRNDYEWRCIFKAKFLLAQLKDFRLGKEVYEM